jgi:hypothetical protein
MTTKHLHVLAIDPGGTSGWVCITVPRLCVFGPAPSEIWEWDYGEFSGAEPVQAIAIARLAREIQSLDYLIGPAIIVEDWDIDTKFKSTDPETLSPVRLGAMLTLLQHQKLLGDATLHFQGRGIAFSTMTDDRLRRNGLWVEGSDHIRAATRHAITALRLARENPVFAKELWPNGA